MIRKYALLFLFIIGLASSAAVMANALFSVANQPAAGSQTLMAAAESMKDPFPLKNSKHYNESNDPAFRRCGTHSDGPQHGFYAVPLLFLIASGILIYFK